MRVVMKDAGAAAPSTPSALNHITLERYRVDYVRADGRNTPGVDVPYGFDGAIRVTIQDSPTTFGFQLVRNQAKDEAPLVFLRSNGAIVTTLAKITFFGRDQNRQRDQHCRRTHDQLRQFWGFSRPMKALKTLAAALATIALTACTQNSAQEQPRSPARPARRRRSLTADSRIARCSSRRTTHRRRMAGAVRGSQ